MFFAVSLAVYSHAFSLTHLRSVHNPLLTQRVRSEHTTMVIWASTEVKLRKELGDVKQTFAQVKRENERIRARLSLLTEEITGLQETKRVLLLEKMQARREGAVAGTN